MKKFEDTMRNLHTAFHLSSAEKDGMRERVHEYMAHTPLRAEGAAQTTSFTSVSWFVRYHRVGAVLTIVALLFGSGIGVSYASTDALPGEALYVVKELKEELVQRLIVDDVRRTEYAIERAQNRLHEIESLAAEGKLDADTEVFVTEKFAISVQRVWEHIAHLDASDVAEAQALRFAFTAGLEARADALATPTRMATGVENDARTRISYIARAHLASRLNPGMATMALMAYEDDGTSAYGSVASDTTRDARSAKGSLMAVEDITTGTDGVVASIPAPEMAMMMVAVQEDSGEASDTNITRMAEHSKTTPATVTALMRTFVKEKEKLAAVHKTTTTVAVRDKLDAVLKNIDETQKALTGALAAGEPARAETLIQDALRIVYQTRASLDASLEIDTSASVNMQLAPDAPNTFW